MINISNEYKNKITNMFGSFGESWVNLIPEKIKKYAEELGLSNLKLVSDLTYNVLIFADSKDYGHVVLKIELPFPEMTIRESKALELSGCSCNIYYKNIEDGIILLERLLPGTSLEEEEIDLENKVKVFSEVAKKFNVKLDDFEGLPTYREILDRSINKSLDDKRFDGVLDMLEKASILYSSLEDDNANYLIHSDLHGNNILKSGDTWKVIDPHGFVGNSILDSAIFIQKELEKTSFSEDNMAALFELVSKYTGYSIVDLCKSLYINYVLNLCWDIEINLDSNHIEKCMENVSIIEAYYNLLIGVRN